MSAFIKEFWVFSKSGEPIVQFEKANDGSQGYNYKMPDLEEETLKKIKEIIQYQSNSKKVNKLITFREEVFNFAQCLKNDSIIFYKTSETAKEKEIKKVCQILGKIFEETYKFNQLKFVEENLDVFEKFQKKLAIYSKLSSL